MGLFRCWVEACLTSFVIVAGDASLAIIRLVRLPGGTIFMPNQFVKKFVTDALSNEYISLMTGSGVSTSNPCNEAFRPVTYVRSCLIVSSDSRGPLITDFALEEGVSPDFGMS